jgi:Iron-containing redox enzyme
MPDKGESRIDAEYVARVLRIEARSLRDVLCGNQMLRWMIEGGAEQPEAGEVRAAYARLLRMSADYVQFTVPALRAASVVLAASGDPSDQAWARRFSSYALDETYAGRGHEVWALDDLTDLGLVELAGAAPYPAALEYGRYFIDGAPLHPYAILGAKSVLEELSVRVASAILSGARAVGAVPASGDEASRFVHHHGDLDVEHGRQGARDLRELQLAQRRQVLEGAFVTTGTYRQLAHHYLS